MARDTKSVEMLDKQKTFEDCARELLPRSYAKALTSGGMTTNQATLLAFRSLFSLIWGLLVRVNSLEKDLKALNKKIGKSKSAGTGAKKSKEPESSEPEEDELEGSGDQGTGKEEDSNPE